ncbi:hypothetical protein QQF64_003178 [Cirrhinus molitorella]|uniref:Uncharacterized protein n=1 Tax=Cirrhinus molitorella TaxID=172907 RepID=A0ABR3MKG9_9TELE
MRTSGQQYRPLSRRKPTSLVQARGAPDDLRRPVPIWSSGQDSWFSPRRPGFDSRYGKAGSSLLPASNGPHVFLRRKPFLASSRAAES